MREPVAREVVVSGRVQGVNFRAWVRARADEVGVVGWAANRADGTVEVWLQGGAEAVAAVERAVGRGPAHASVDEVSGRDVAPRDGLARFERR